MGPFKGKRQIDQKGFSYNNSCGMQRAEVKITWNNSTSTGKRISKRNWNLQVFDIKSLCMNIKEILLSIIAILALCSCTFFSLGIATYESVPSFNDLKTSPLDAEGWTVIPQSEDSRLVYVSSSLGSDDNNGLSEDSPVASIEAGRALIRNGYPDRLLLKRDDQWDESIIGWSLSGRSQEEPIIISSYGTGNRPILLNGRFTTGFHDDIHHTWIIGLDFYNSLNDPTSDNYDSEADHNTAIAIIGGSGLNLTDILIEDCRFQYYGSSMVLQRFEADKFSNIRLRRNIISHSYRNEGHSQGIYASHIDGFLVEECIFDHNGWLHRPDEGIGVATMFNHNIYISSCNQVVYRRNLFLRGSSMGNKFRSDTSLSSIDILIEDNFYYDGEIGIGIGGNTFEPRRFGKVRIVDNVFSEIGKSNHTKRNFSWALDVSDNFETLISNNCFVNQNLYSNSYAIKISGETARTIQVEKNLFYRVSGSSLQVEESALWEEINIINNQVDDHQDSFRIAEQIQDFGNVHWGGNRYYSSLDEPFRYDRQSLDYSQWVAYTGDSSTLELSGPSYRDPGRNLESYDAFLGGDGSLQHFLDTIIGMQKGQWDSRFTAGALNDYIREGYDWPQFGE